MPRRNAVFFNKTQYLNKSIIAYCYCYYSIILLLLLLLLPLAKKYYIALGKKKFLIRRRCTQNSMEGDGREGGGRLNDVPNAEEIKSFWAEIRSVRTGHIG